MPTYTPLQSIQLASSSSTVTFSGILQNYQDLVLVISATSVAGGGEDLRIQVNGDTGANYSATWFDSHYNSSPTTGRLGNRTNFQLTNYVGLSSTEPTLSIVNFANYSNTTTYKPMIARHTQFQGTYYETMLLTNSWKSTSAINNISVYTSASAFSAGSTFDLYGISPVAAQNAQAAGGTEIYYDSSYVYHVFKGSGTFTPYRNLTCDYLVVAGGGGGGPQVGGAGGAGGLRLASSGSFTSGTVYTITVGAGGPGAGAYSSYGKNGNNTSISGSGFSTYSVTGGGGGGYHGATATSGQSGGSGGSPGGGNSGSVAAGSGNAGSYSPVEGYAGGTSLQNGTFFTGGGGGAGGVGANASAGVAGVGGVGASVYNSIDFSSWLTATSTGSGGKLAGGGGGCANSGSVGGSGGAGGGGNGSGPSDAGLTSGVTNTGGGGGASRDGTGAAGGSGIVIVRYAR